MWLNLAPSSREERLRLTPKRYKRIIRHEFGHALGLQHEHQHPGAPPLYDNTKLRNYLSTRYEEESLKNKMKLRWEKVSASVWGPMSSYDPHSVMHLMIPKKIRSQNYTGPTVLPLEFSAGDKMRIVALYSGEDEEVVEDITLTDEEEREMYEEALEEGWIAAGEDLLILLGVTGSGKTEFKRIVLRQRVPSYSPSTPLASRPISVCNMAVNGVKWKEMGPNKMLNMVAEKMKERGWRLNNPATVSSQQDDSSNVPNEREDAVPAPQLTTRSDRVSEQELPSVEEKLPVNQNTPVMEEQESSVGLDQEFDKALKEIDLKLIQAMRESSSGDTKPQSLMGVDFIYLLDSGGQPPFREMLPHFVQQASAIVLMQKLNERLDFRPTIRYREEGGKVDKGYISQLTNEQILHQYVQGVQSHKHSRVFVIGTHRDREKECKSETRKDKNQKLLESFGEVLKGQLMLYSNRELMFSLNCRSRKKADKQVAQEFKERVMEEFKRKPKKRIPLPWFILKQLLQLLAEKMGKPILSLEECCKAAQEKLRMPEDRCKAALNHLTKLNIIFFRPEILPEVVFSNVQVILNKITELVHCNHSLRQNETDDTDQTGSTDESAESQESSENSEPEETSDYSSESSESDEDASDDALPDPVPDAMKTDKGLEFRDFGIVDSELLENSFPSHYRQDVFASPDFLLLLERMLIAGRLITGEHFIPSLLPDLPIEKIAEYRATADHPPPLVIYYPKMWLPVGVMSSLVVYLQNQCQWELSKERSYHNCFLFDLPRGKPGDMVLIDSIEFLELHVRSTCKLSATIFHEIKSYILTGLEEAHTSLHYNPPDVKPGFLCSCERGETNTHFATPDGDKVLWKCSKNNKMWRELSKDEKLWLEETTEDEPLDTGCVNNATNHTPIEEFSEVKSVLQPVKERWQEIGVVLGLDLGTLKKWRRECEENHDEYLEKMLSLWENKKYNTKIFGKPSWEFLARAVGDSAGGDDPTLAEKITNTHVVSVPGISDSAAVGTCLLPNHEQAEESEREQRQQGTKETTLTLDNLHDVRSVLQPVTHRWKHIGLALRLDLGQLKKIKKENSDDLDDCLTEMLSLWLNKNYNTERFGEPSWELLANAVGDSAGGNDCALAEKIRQKYLLPRLRRYEPNNQQ